jgi:hypothetical protein
MVRVGSEATGRISRQVLEPGVEIHRVEDAIGLLVDFRIYASRSPNHLVIEDAAIHSPDED